MDSATTARVIAAAIAARAALDSLLLALTEVAPDETPGEGTMTDEEGPRGCPHENKKRMGTFGAAEHWVCEDCGLEYRR